MDEELVEGPPQKPVRNLSRIVACCQCGGKDETYCPDCKKPLCLQTECDLKHAKQCPPVKRELLSGSQRRLSEEA